VFTTPSTEQELTLLHHWNKSGLISVATLALTKRIYLQTYSQAALLVGRCSSIMSSMLDSTVPKNPLRTTHRSKNADPEAQSTTHMLAQTNTDRSSIQPVASTPEEQEAERKRNTYSGLPGCLDFFWGGVYAPGASTYDPIEILLNTEDAEEREADGGLER
jgi:hypothetical protein